jgi:hypothetical protein
MARICSAVSGSGTAPPERAKIRNGTTSGVAWAKMQVTNLRMFS